MGGGLMQLVAYGAQDVYLTGNPQITFFKVVYRRHTNFSMECIEQPLDSAKFGGRHTVQVLRNGDLAGRMYLKTTLPQLDAATTTSKCAWVRRVGHALIDNIECTVGGSQVDKHWGVWYDLWYELTHTEEQSRGYAKMIGDVSECTTLASSVKAYTLYIPLQFWFNRNTGLALPLIALQYHEVRFNIQFEQFANLVCYTGSAAPLLPSANLSDTSILVDYIYLDQEERRRMAQVGHEYLIEQVQFGNTESVTGANQKVKLDFNHPCKELIWATRVGKFANGQKYLAHHHTSAEQTLEDAARNLAYGMVSTVETTGSVNVDTSNNDAEDVAANSVGIINVTHESTTFTFVVSNESDASYKGDGLWVNGEVLKYGTTNVCSDIAEVTVNVFVSGTGSQTVRAISINDVTVTRHTLSLANVSFPLGDALVTDRRATAHKVNDVTVNQHFNYGLDLAGNGNPVYKAKLQLNGQDRFDEQEGSYFNYVQPAQHHTHTPVDGVNVYSFGLNPEQHQPSGTANLSRIDTTLLHLQFRDMLNTTNGGDRRFSLDVVSDSNLWIFAFSYNVFRIMSGMGGLAYAN
jgi:hypothetical protein